MKKINLFTVGILLVMLIPFVSAWEQSDAPLDLFSLFVVYTFGNIIFSYFGLTLIFLVIGMVSRFSRVTLWFTWFMFSLTFMSGFFGVLLAIPFFILGGVYFIYGMMKMFAPNF